MKYSITFLKICKPIYKLGILAFRIGIILTIIGLIIGLFSKLWLILCIGIGCCVISPFIWNLPTVYLAYLIKGIINSESYTSGQITKVVQNHLKENRQESWDSIYFIDDIQKLGIESFLKEKPVKK